MSSRIISKKERVFDWVNTLLMLIVIVLTLYPFWYVIVASVSSISHVTNSVVLLWPDGLNWDAYQQVFRNNLVPTAYGNTLFITIVGTVISMLLTCISAFVLSRRELPGLEEFYSRLIHIPCGWWVSGEERERIVSCIKRGW